MGGGSAGSGGRRWAAVGGCGRLWAAVGGGGRRWAAVGVVGAGLQRLAEAHLVRENPVELTRGEREHPVEALDLRAHRHGGGGWHRGANTRRGVRGCGAAHRRPRRGPALAPRRRSAHLVVAHGAVLNARGLHALVGVKAKRDHSLVLLLLGVTAARRMAPSLGAPGLRPARCARHQAAQEWRGGSWARSRARCRAG